MKILKAVKQASMSVAALGLLGSDAFLGGWPRQRPVYVRRQPQYVEQQPQYIVVQQAPPTVIVERRPPPPSAAHVWIEGYWNWDQRQYRWEAGHYAVPPRPNAIWVAPRYDHENQGYRYTPGTWRQQNENDGRGR